MITARYKVSTEFFDVHLEDSDDGQVMYTLFDKNNKPLTGGILPQRRHIAEDILSLLKHVKESAKDDPRHNAFWWVNEFSSAIDELLTDKVENIRNWVDIRTKEYDDGKWY